jgi:DNA-binding transcriptional LysR family regulator
MESSNIDSIKQLAVSGMGLAFLPEISIEVELKQKMLKPIALDELRIERPVTVYWKERRVLPRPAQVILKFLEKRSQAAVPAGTAKA